MEFNPIRYFLNLADTLNFTEASMRSGVSQPTLTCAIQRLEQELGRTNLRSVLKAAGAGFSEAGP